MAQEVLSVSFALRQLEALAQTDDQRRVAGEAQGVIGRILDELHNISVDLRPLSLDHLGFVAALHSSAAVLEKTYGTRIVFEGGLARERFDRAHETQAYRICQEALLNACKYSGADEVLVQLGEADGWLRVSVRDAGPGFDTAHPVIRGSGCGLAGMRERASLIGATLRVESGPDGTAVTLVAPMSGAGAVLAGDAPAEGAPAGDAPSAGAASPAGDAAPVAEGGAR